ncbi:MAG TPA: hypothetical protein VMS55_08455 [Myxococcota bacterium]|nr:hypothetical protein [Myxococcota bacterium]
MFITDDCIDPVLNTPYIDIDEMRTTPVPHRFVHGGFTGTDTKFSIAFPPAAQYQGRFIEGPTHQLNDETLSADQISFVLASGGYAVASNQGGSGHCTTTECAVFGGLDPTIGGYRANAAAAKYSRQLAMAYYGTSKRPYGYIHGGSGGAYQTVSSLENTSIYDGGVPFVLGSEAAIPTAYTVRINAQRILGSAGKFPCIDQAYDAGGSGDPVTECSLNEEQAGALQEATYAGFPTRGWFGSALTGAGALPLIASYPPYLDPTYTNDFWTLPGYLGHDDPYGSLAPLRFQDPAGARTVVAISPPFLVLNSVPSIDLAGVNLIVDSGAAQGKTYSLLLAIGTAVFPFGANLSDFQPGDKVHIDNSAYLALQTYHRHQIGGPVQAYYVFDQFRNPFGDPNGTPIYPQRSVLTGIAGQYNGSGGHMTGSFHGKMIVQESLMDVDAHPYGADWYKRRVEHALCAPAELWQIPQLVPVLTKFCNTPIVAKLTAHARDDRFRLYFQDYAQHGGGGGTSPRTVTYQGALQQALRDVAKWAEQGVKPPVSTEYQMVGGGQVSVPGNAAARKGIQPVVTLLANGVARAEVAVGETVTLSGTIETPPGGGQVVSVEWNVEGTTGGFVSTAFGAVAPSVTVSTTHVFTAPGTYFPVLRASSQREGDPATPFARIDNIGRVRVVVSP